MYKKFRRFISLLLCAVLTVCSCGAADDNEGKVTDAVNAEIIPYISGGSEWHDEYAIVAHALGTVDGRVETNCREAFIESYGKGQRVFECDFTLTSDGHLVCRHDFLDMSYYNLEQEPGGEYVMDYERYKNSVIKFLYTPLDIEGLIELMETYPDTYLITDSKDTDRETVTKEFVCMREAIDAAGDEGLYDRIIVQLYNDEMYDTVREVYPFGNFIYTLYQTARPDYAEIGSFCASHGIAVVTMSYERMSPEVCDILHMYGLKVYLHTVNRIGQMLNWNMMGADGFYCDYVTQTDWTRAAGK